MMGRIASRRHSLEEEDAFRLVQVLAISRVVYSRPYLTLKSQERKQLEALIRRAYKQASAIPPNTSTKRVLALRIHSIVAEHVEAHLISQRERLRLTLAGRQVRTRLGYPTQTSGHGQTFPLNTTSRTKIHVAPLPPNNSTPSFIKGAVRLASALSRKNFKTPETSDTLVPLDTRVVWLLIEV